MVASDGDVAQSGYSTAVYHASGIQVILGYLHVYGYASVVAYTHLMNSEVIGKTCLAFPDTE